MDFNVKDFGAVGDGKTLNTKFIHDAIEECAKQGGGRVIIENGTYLCGSIEMRSFVELHIAANAVLLGSDDCINFPERTNVKHVDTNMLPRERNACFIFADECENIALTGQGKIDCNGDKFVYYERDVFWKYNRIDAPTPPRVVFFTGCKNVKIEDITMVNQPAGWSYWIHDCDYVSIDKIKIFANVDYPNNDGIHINCSRNVTVSNCDITCGDDCIIVRANSASLKTNKVCEKVSVTNCNLTSYSGGIRVGWVNDGVIRNCVFSNLVMTDTTVGISILLPPSTRPEFSDVGREETLIDNLSFNNIVMDKICSNPVLIHIYENEKIKVKAIKNLHFSEIHAKGLNFPKLIGRESAVLQNIRFNNCSFEMINTEEIPNRFAHGATTTNDDLYHPMEIRFAEIIFNDCELRVK